MSLKDRLRLAELAVEPGRKIESDHFALKADPDGVVREECWFCGNEVQFRLGETTGSDAAVVIELLPLGGGKPTHGICHSSCAERAKGSLAV